MSAIRRGMMRGGANVDPWEDWIKVHVKNSSNSKLICNIHLSTIDRMVIDGNEITPVNDYDFGDTTTYHNVFILLKDFAKLNAYTLWQNFTIRYVDYPAKIASYSDGALRNSGASQRGDIAIRATEMPTFESYNWIGWSAGHLYVPSDLISAYKTLTGFADSKIHPLEDYPYDFNI